MMKKVAIIGGQRRSGKTTKLVDIALELLANPNERIYVTGGNNSGRHLFDSIAAKCGTGFKVTHSTMMIVNLETGSSLRLLPSRQRRDGITATAVLWDNINDGFNERDFHHVMLSLVSAREPKLFATADYWGPFDYDEKIYCADTRRAMNR